MDTQKIQAGAKSTKGFTLVELIVVITILVILGTIAFLNIGSFSASARDSQRTSDLNQINSQVMTLQTKNATPYLNMLSGTVANTLTGTAAALGGSGMTAGVGFATSLYNAGDINYPPLGIDSAKMSDPIKKVPYKMGATTYNGGVYELAASLEETSTALVMGIYRPRTTTVSATISSTGANNVVSLGSTGVGLFYVNDYVGNGAWTGTISKIVSNSSNGVDITISNGTTVTTGGTLYLAKTEMAGLVGTSTGATAVINKGAALPY